MLFDKLSWVTRDEQLEKQFCNSIKTGREQGSLRNIKSKFKEKNIKVYDAMNQDDCKIMSAFIEGASLCKIKLSYITITIRSTNFKSNFTTFFKPEDANKIKTILSEVIVENVLEN